MEDNNTSIEMLIERTTDYAKTSLELAKLKTLDKTSDLVSSVIPHSIEFIILGTFIIFLNLGIAFWLGEILGGIYFGFFVIAGFYLLCGLIVHFLMYNKLKSLISNYIIKQILK